MLFSKCTLPPPALLTPVRSPLMSVANTGTPIALNVSARFCSEQVLPVPVAPAMRPWRLAIEGIMPRCFSPAMALNGVPVLSIIALLLGCFLLFRLLSPNTLPYPDSIILFYGKVMIKCVLYWFRQLSPLSVTQFLFGFSLHCRRLQSAVEPYQCHTHVFALWYYHPLQHPHPLVHTFSPFVLSFKLSSFSA